MTRQPQVQAAVLRSAAQTLDAAAFGQLEPSGDEGVAWLLRRQRDRRVVRIAWSKAIVGAWVPRSAESKDRFVRRSDYIVDDADVDVGEFVRSYPRLFHLTAPAAWPMIARHGLRSVTAILDLLYVDESQRDRFEAEHRRDSAVVSDEELGALVIRDQKPLNPSKLADCLDDGMTPEESYRPQRGEWNRRDAVSGQGPRGPRSGPRGVARA